MYQDQLGRVPRPPVFLLPSPPPFSLSFKFVYKLALWWAHLWFSPIIYIAKLIYSKLAPYAIPPIDFLWRNKFNFLKAGILFSMYIITTLLFAISTYLIIRSFFIVKEHSYNSLYFNFNHPLPIASAQFEGGSFVHGQPYNAVIDLELPESPPNIDVGMFMITLKLFAEEDSGNSSLIMESSRPCMLRYKTGLLRAVHSISFSLPSLVGLYEQKQSLDVPLAENFIPNQSYSLVRAVVELSKPGIQLYSSVLHIRASLSWLSYLVLRWPVTSFIIGTAITFIMHAPWLGLIYLLIYIRISSSVPARAPAIHTVYDSHSRPISSSSATTPSSSTTHVARPHTTNIPTFPKPPSSPVPTAPPTPSRVLSTPQRAGLWVGIMDELEEEDEERREMERKELEAELRERLAERRREREEGEKHFAEAREREREREKEKEKAKEKEKEEKEKKEEKETEVKENRNIRNIRKVQDNEDSEGEDSEGSAASRSSGSSTEWVAVDDKKDSERDEDDEEEDGESSSSGLRRRRV